MDSISSSSLLVGAGPNLYSAGPEFQVNNYTAGHQLDPSVASLESGFIVCWQDVSPDSSHDGIFRQRFTDTGYRIGMELRIAEFPLHVRRLAQVASYSDGYFAVWDSFGQDGSRTGIYGQLFSMGGTQTSSEIRLNDATSGDQQKPNIARLPDGFVAVWWGTSPRDLEGIYGQLIDDTGSRVGTNFYVNSRTTGRQANAYVTSAPYGFTVVWQSLDQDGNAWGVYAQHFNNTAHPLGLEFRVNDHTIGNQADGTAASLPSGTIITWASTGQDGDGNGIYAKLFDPQGGMVGREFRVNNVTDGHQSYANAVELSTGFVIVWTGEDSDGTGIFGQLFSGDGQKIGSEFLINDYQLSNQAQVDVAAVSSGFVVVWRSEGQDGDGYGIFARIFSLTAKTTLPALSSPTQPLITSHSLAQLATTTAGFGTAAVSTASSSGPITALAATVAVLVAILLLGCGGAVLLYFKKSRQQRDGEDRGHELQEIEARHVGLPIQKPQYVEGSNELVQQTGAHAHSTDGQPRRTASRQGAAHHRARKQPQYDVPKGRLPDGYSAPPRQEKEIIHQRDEYLEGIQEVLRQINALPPVDSSEPGYMALPERRKHRSPRSPRAGYIAVPEGKRPV